jgi:hypothetical protein
MSQTSSFSWDDKFGTPTDSLDIDFIFLRDSLHLHVIQLLLLLLVVVLVLSDIRGDIGRGLTYHVI